MIIYKNDNISLILRQLLKCAGKLFQCFLVQKRIIRFFCGIYCVIYQFQHRVATLFFQIIINRIARYGIDPCGKRSLGFIVFIKIAIHFQKYGLNNVLYFGLVVYFGADKAEDLITVLRIDETAILFDKIYVSAGMRGEQVILNPETLAEFIGADFADVTKG